MVAGCKQPVSAFRQPGRLPTPISFPPESKEVAVHQPHESTDGPSDITDLLQAVGGMAKALRSMNSASESDHGARAILSALYRCGPVRPSDLAGTCMLDISTISRHARQLESEQLVAKIADPE